MSDPMRASGAKEFTPGWVGAAAAAEPPSAPGGARPAISFAYGVPDPALFPAEALAAAGKDALLQHGDRALQYGAVLGLPQLIAGLLARLRDREGLDLAPGQCLITAGSSQAIGLVAHALIAPGDAVLLETPAWPGVINALRRYQARAIPVPMDQEGLDPAALEQTLARLQAEGVRPKLLYTVPTYQNPTGITMTAGRRAAVLALARRYDLLILEDDAYRDIAFDAPPPPSLLALDVDGRVLRTGTYSKILAAGLRLGWLLGPAAAISRISAVKDDGGTSPFASYVTATFAEAGALEAHIALLVNAYREKRDAMLRALERAFPPGAQWTRPAGGFFIWVTLPEGLDSGALLPRARAAGVDFLPGRACFPDPADGARYIRLAFSQGTPDEIEDGIARLAGVIAAAR
jgi:2-aminoadipate transaminase